MIAGRSSVGVRVLAAAALVAIGWLAGRGARSDAPAPAATVARAAPSRAVAAHGRVPDGPTDAYALVAELRAASRQPDLETQAAALDALADRWRGRPVRWRVLIPAALCRRRDACYALPFDHADARAVALAPIIEGWLPRLDIDAAGMAAIEACGAEACAADVAGVVHEMTASVELPTAVTIGVARVTAIEAPRATERWTR